MERRELYPGRPVYSVFGHSFVVVGHDQTRDLYQLKLVAYRSPSFMMDETGTVIDSIGQVYDIALEPTYYTPNVLNATHLLPFYPHLACSLYTDKECLLFQVLCWELDSTRFPNLQPVQWFIYSHLGWSVSIQPHEYTSVEVESCHITLNIGPERKIPTLEIPGYVYYDYCPAIANALVDYNKAIEGQLHG